MGVLVLLLPAAIDDSEIHNLRSAFIAGLADGMGTTVAILQEGYDPVPIDYRDFVTVITHPAQIDEAIADLAGEVIQKFSERSEEHTSELQSLMRISYAVFCLKKKTNKHKS